MKSYFRMFCYFCELETRMASHDQLRPIRAPGWSRHLPRSHVTFSQCVVGKSIHTEYSYTRTINNSTASS